MSWILVNLLPFLVILTILVFVHELGHFLIARRNGVKVTTFSIGFGPELLGWTDRHQTRWRFSLIPLGGYVKMLGDADPSSGRADESLQLDEQEKSHTLHNKTPLQRMAVAFAGPAANILFTIVALSLTIMVKGMPHLAPVIAKVEPGMLADQSGIVEGDTIHKVNQKSVKDFYTLRRIIQESVGKDIELEIERNGEILHKKISLYQMDPTTQEKKPIKRLGIMPPAPIYISHNPFMAIVHGICISWDLTLETFQSLYGLITGKHSSHELGGILSIGEMAAQSTKSGLTSVIWLMALLSINLALINLLPIPVLDGGHILLCAIEMIRGKPLSAKAQEYIFLLGFLIVGSVMLFATWNDLLRYKVFHIFKSWF